MIKPKPLAVSRLPYHDNSSSHNMCQTFSRISDHTMAVVVQLVNAVLTKQVITLQHCRERCVHWPLCRYLLGNPCRCFCSCCATQVLGIEVRSRFALRARVACEQGCRARGLNVLAVRGRNLRLFIVCMRGKGTRGVANRGETCAFRAYAG